MTLNRNLYGFRHWMKFDPDNYANVGNFYHSSYTRGSDVICTGCLTADNGTITYVNNFSGHYQPPPSQLQLFVDSLRTFGVPLQKVDVEFVIPPFETFQTEVMAATAFLNDVKYRKQQFNINFEKPRDDLRKQHGVRRKGFSEKNQRVLQVRNAIHKYIERSGGIFSRPSAISKETADRLSKTVNNDVLLQEVRFVITQGSVSPYNTPVDKRLTNGELWKKLTEALNVKH